jgi:hypothetical protein
MLVIDVPMYLSDDCLHELIGLWLSKGLVKIHNIPHHFGVEGYWMTHTIL